MSPHQGVHQLPLFTAAIDRGTLLSTGRGDVCWPVSCLAAGALVSACCDAAVMRAESVTVCLAVALLGRANQYSLKAAPYGLQ